MFNGFFVSDVTRAFVSCVVGVQKVGISMLMFSCVTSVVCYVNGKIVQRFGRLYSIIFAFITTFTLLIVFLLWQPTESTSYVVYVTFALVGIPNGCWSIILQSSYSDAFYKNKEVSFNVWNITFTAGFALQFAISALLCVRDKIYVLIALLCVGSLCIGWLEVKSGRRRSPRHDSTTSL
uniref:Major facilitator superfamily (MFS) profile domain-containing protein n=1 Tax=Ciona savignyi TaxID=51511 RepID=H2ZI23_CIOSA